MLNDAHVKTIKLDCRLLSATTTSTTATTTAATHSSSTSVDPRLGRTVLATRMGLPPTAGADARLTTAAPRET